jgi:hypothetical protein
MPGFDGLEKLPDIQDFFFHFEFGDNDDDKVFGYERTNAPR